MAFAAALAPVLGILGAGVSAVGAIEGGHAQANAANYNAEVARNNATIANQNAEYSLAAGSEKATVEGLKGAETAGALKATQAASGIDVNTGSAVDVQRGQREKSVLDTATTMNNAELQAYGYRTQSTGFTAQAGLDEAEAEQAPIGAGLSAAGGLLGSASSLSFKWQGGSPSTGTTETYPTVAQDQP